jgi:hypothetical protein
MQFLQQANQAAIRSSELIAAFQPLADKPWNSMLCGSSGPIESTGLKRALSRRFTP